MPPPQPSSRRHPPPPTAEASPRPPTPSTAARGHLLISEKHVCKYQTEDKDDAVAVANCKYQTEASLQAAKDNAVANCKDANCKIHKEACVIADTCKQVGKNQACLQINRKQHMASKNQLMLQMDKG